MLISLIMQIAQSMQISIRHFLTPQTMYITFSLKKTCSKTISGLVCLVSIQNDDPPTRRFKRFTQCQLGEVLPHTLFILIIRRMLSCQESHRSTRGVGVNRWKLLKLNFSHSAMLPSVKKSLLN